MYTSETSTNFHQTARCNNPEAKTHFFSRLWLFTWHWRVTEWVCCAPGMRTWTKFIRLRIWFSCRLCWPRKLNFGFYTRKGISCLTEPLLTSQTWFYFISWKLNHLPAGIQTITHAHLTTFVTYNIWIIKPAASLRLSVKQFDDMQSSRCWLAFINVLKDSL